MILPRGVKGVKMRGKFEIYKIRGQKRSWHRELMGIVLGKFGLAHLGCGFEILGRLNLIYDFCLGKGLDLSVMFGSNI